MCTTRMDKTELSDFVNERNVVLFSIIPFISHELHAATNESSQPCGQQTHKRPSDRILLSKSSNTRSQLAQPHNTHLLHPIFPRAIPF